MTTESSKNDNESAEQEKGASSETVSACGPGCACGEPASKGKTKLKIAVCLVAIVAVAGILVFKTTNALQSSSLTGTNGFSNQFAAASKGEVTNSAGQKGGSGASLSAIAELNTVADKLNTVFLVIPSKDNNPTSKETVTVLASVERTLNAKGLSTGIYTLKTSSADYPDVAAKVTPPGIAVLSKGGGIGFVSGGISESNLMQAYVASTRSGGCGPSGCPPPTDGKAAVPCK
jgi:hypothetical protein